MRCVSKKLFIIAFQKKKKKKLTIVNVAFLALKPQFRNKHIKRVGGGLHNLLTIFYVFAPTKHFDLKSVCHQQ